MTVERAQKKTDRNLLDGMTFEAASQQALISVGSNMLEYAAMPIFQNSWFEGSAAPSSREITFPTHWISEHWPPPVLEPSGNLPSTPPFLDKGVTARRGSDAEHKIGLATLPIFAELSNEELQQALQLSTRRIFRSGELINDPVNAVVITIEGNLNAQLRDLAGERISLSDFPAGSLVGEKKHLLPQSNKRNSDPNIELKAVGEVSALIIPHEFFEKVIAPKASAEIIRQLEFRLEQMNQVTYKRMIGVDSSPGLQPAEKFSDKLADRMTGFFGSWKAIFGFYGFSAAWMGAHMAGAMRFDVYPFIFLNLAFSMLSAGSTFVILKSQNRQNELQRLAEQRDSKLAKSQNRAVKSLSKTGHQQRQLIEKLQAAVETLTSKMEAGRKVG